MFCCNLCYILMKHKYSNALILTLAPMCRLNKPIEHCSNYMVIFQMISLYILWPNLFYSALGSILCGWVNNTPLTTMLGAYMARYWADLPYYSPKQQLFSTNINPFWLFLATNWELYSTKFELSWVFCTDFQLNMSTFDLFQTITTILKPIMHYYNTLSTKSVYFQTMLHYLDQFQLFSNKNQTFPTIFK